MTDVLSTTVNKAALFGGSVGGGDCRVTTVNKLVLVSDYEPNPFTPGTFHGIVKQVRFSATPKSDEDIEAW